MIATRVACVSVLLLVCLGLPGAACLGAEADTEIPWTLLADLFSQDRLCPVTELVQTSGDPVDMLSAAHRRRHPNFASKPGESIVVSRERFDSGQASRPDDLVVEIARGRGPAWEAIPGLRHSSQAPEVILPQGLPQEGFYRLRWTGGDPEGPDRAEAVYCLVQTAWKRGLLAFCRQWKEDVELHADPQLFRSCIAVSHFDHCMELVSEASALGGEILTALAHAVRAKRCFDRGECPDLVVGLNKIRLKRFAGATLEDFAVFVPADYDASRAWPLFLHTDNRWRAARDHYTVRSGLVDLWWHTASHDPVKWKDYCAIAALLKEKLRIDEDRVYVDGDCGNGIAAMALVLNYPDQWAEYSASLGNSHLHMAGNALNLPLVYVKGVHEEAFRVVYYDFAVKCFRHWGCRRFQDSKTQDIAQARGTPLPQAVRERYPQRVFYATDSRAKSQAYWLKIEGRENENLLGSVDASIRAQTVLLETQNVDAYSLSLDGALLDVNQPIEIIENGHGVGRALHGRFSRRSARYSDALYLKDDHLPGPLRDVFTDPFVVVWGGSGRDESLTRLNEKTARALANGGSCVADTAFSADMARDHHLVLVGTPQSNGWLARMGGRLPARYTAGEIVAAGQTYRDGDFGLLQIHPNPLNPRKYVAVFCGTSARAVEQIPRAFADATALRPADVGVFEVTGSGDIRWRLLERFDSLWQWHEGWDRVLARGRRVYPPGRWRQWIARMLRTHLQADVAIVDDPFAFDPAGLVGEITYRDLFNAFDNTWYTRVRVDGKTLRALLTAPFEASMEGGAEALTLEGVSLFPTPGRIGEGTLALHELRDEAFYSLVLPQSQLIGGRVGLVLRDYDILDHCFLIPSLEASLSLPETPDLEQQMETLKLKVF